MAALFLIPALIGFGFVVIAVPLVVILCVVTSPASPRDPNRPKWFDD
jgi:hypothetical protein